MSRVETVTVGVRGFHCSGCADTLGGTLSRLEGVIRASADFDRGEVDVRFDPDLVTEQDLLEGIRTAGFEPA